MGYELKNIKKEDIEFYKGVFTEGDYIKFLELLRDIDSKSEVEINKIHKKLIVDTLILQRKRLRVMLTDRPNLLQHIHTVMSIGHSLDLLLERFNKLGSINDICRIIDVSHERIIEGLAMCEIELSGEYDETKEYDNMFDYLILCYGIENKNDNVFYIANHMADILKIMDKRVCRLG
ncbi:hypothetical protein [Clostridium estertheticum]|uniref:hypothetical protein n=1 Tax=Clostridium estertheticum TaxID=238834 RepID=UPI001C0BA5F6|nr:hypothetical protein [Clostridium estertheticum]MBU3075620.1 hypothetical protein [Clostridium estertheticum]MBU3164798.1 hypothetical protein [Clostridium estertheticum]